MREAAAAVARFVAERDWQHHHTPRNVAAALAVEAGELLEIHQWGVDWPVPNQQARMAEEVADVLIYALAYCNAAGIDPDEAVAAKMKKNEAKYPKPPQSAADGG